MTEAVTINNEELAILCDIVSGWGVKKCLHRRNCSASCRCFSGVRSKRAFRHPPVDSVKPC